VGAALSATRPPAGSGLRDAGFFVLRAPVLPLRWFTRWAEDAQLRSSAGSDEALEVAARADRVALRRQLAAWSSDPVVREAIFVASPALFASLPVWEADPESAHGRKIERAIVRYLSRMCARPTPFGLFAGVALGELGDATRLELAPIETHRRHARLDVDYLACVTEALQRDRGLARGLGYRPNDSLYRVGSQLRYVELVGEGASRAHRMTAVVATEPLEAILAAAAGGASFDALREALQRTVPELADSDATSFLWEVVDSQLLVSSLRVGVTGGEPLAQIIAALATTGARHGAADALAELQRELDALARPTRAAGAERYDAAQRALGALPAGSAPSRPFHVDTVLATRAATLGHAVVAEVGRAVAFLQRVSPPVDHPLAGFATAFRRRYGDREVALLEALDDDLGVGLRGGAALASDPSPLLAGIQLPARPVPDKVAWGDVQVMLGRRLGDALRLGADEIVLSEAEVVALGPESPPPLEPALAAMITIVATSEAAVARGDYRLVISSVDGRSGAAFLGRFCHLDDALCARVRSLCAEEASARPDAIFAEIVHLPPGRIGNMIVRPVLRDHEIPYLTRAGVADAQQLPVGDLQVSVDATGQIRLRSQRLGREIIPRLASAHAYDGGLPLYQFLASLQSQTRPSGYGFGWGAALRSAPYLPRLVVGRWVFALARWQLDRSWLTRLATARGLGGRLGVLQALRVAQRVPRFVSVEDGDHVLPVDLDNVLSVDSFVELARGRDTLRLQELYPGDDDLVVRGPDGGFRHELVVPLISEPRPRATPPALARGERADRTARSFSFGDDWLLVRLHAGAITGDQVLGDAIAPFIAEVRAAGLIEGWFFTRVHEPEPHVEVLVRGSGLALLGEVLPRLRAHVEPFVRDGRIWKLQCDTYERALERFGGAAGIPRAELLFEHDSDAALEIFGACEDDELADARWQLALRGAALWLDDFALALPAKRGVLAALRGSLEPEVAVDLRLRRQLGARFRQDRHVLDELVARPGRIDHPLAPGFAILAARSRRSEPAIAALRAALAPNVLWTTLVPNVVRAQMRRFLRGAQQAQELVIYDFLTRLYASEAARG
jgi:lantibiotic biosynthesis protein